MAGRKDSATFPVDLRPFPRRASRIRSIEVTPRVFPAEAHLVYSLEGLSMYNIPLL
jgi:hypothetical protein